MQQTVAAGLSAIGPIAMPHAALDSRTALVSVLQRTPQSAMGMAQISGNTAMQLVVARGMLVLGRRVPHPAAMHSERARSGVNLEIQLIAADIGQRFWALAAILVVVHGT